MPRAIITNAPNVPACVLAIARVLVLSAGHGRCADAVFDAEPPALVRLALGSKDNILGQRQLWVNSGGMTVNPTLDDVAGVGNIVAPPWTTTNHRLEVTFNGARVAADSHCWRPGEFERHARMESGVAVRTLVSPAVGERGLIEWIEVHNTTAAGQRIAIGISSRGRFGELANDRWKFSAAPSTKGLAEIRMQSPHAGWAQSVVKGNEWVVASNLSGLQFNKDSFGGEIMLAPGQGVAFAIVMAAGRGGGAGRLAKELLDSPQAGIAANRRLWEQRLATLHKHAPRVSSSNKELVDFYERSLLSYLIARWDLPELALNPWYATSGVDGGALCSYVWDFAYVSRIGALTVPEAVRGQIRLFLKADLTQGYAVLPFDGRITGTRYAYNDYSLIRLIHNYVRVTGDRAFLNERIGDKTVWELAYKHAVHLEELDKPVRLLDCGDNHNLLEMKLTGDYTHFVPSPNAERCWSYRAVDEMARWAGTPDPGLSHRADELAKVLRQQLWSPKERWFMSLDQNGRQQPGYSIQVFDLLRLDLLNEEEREGILSHLNDKEFLSAWGVHSYAKTAAGYDPRDVDWGGPGVYTGDAPELAGDLYHAGCFKQADDIFARILWWGQSLPYYPQAIRADSRDYRRDGRSNVIAGAAAAEMMVFDLLGLRIGMDGTVVINPHLPAFARDLKFEGLVIRGQRLDVALAADGYQVTSNGGVPARAAYRTPTRLPAGAPESR